MKDPFIKVCDLTGKVTEDDYGSHVLLSIPNYNNLVRQINILKLIVLNNRPRDGLTDKLNQLSNEVYIDERDPPEQI